VSLPRAVVLAARRHWPAVHPFGDRLRCPSEDRLTVQVHQEAPL